jgi:trehalose 6-phosphate synthase
VRQLVVAANRGPFTLAESEDGSVTAGPTAGGLAPSLAAALSAGGEEAVWVATARGELERRVAAAGGLETGDGSASLRFVDVGEAIYRAAYDVVANSTLWFLLHGLFDLSRRPLFDRRFREAWQSFREFNAAFAERICEESAQHARVLVNDYHLPLVGRLLAEKRPDLKTVHFTHTPFPTPAELGVLPRDVAQELLAGLAGFGACGFHTARWERAFAECAGAVLGGAPPAFNAPLGADRPRLEEVAGSPDCTDRLEQLRQRVADRLVIVRSDRIELSKNLLRGLLAFDALLEERADLRGRCCLVARAYSSREGLAEYLAYRSEFEHLAAVLNERWAARCGGEDPVILDIGDDFAGTVAALRHYDVLLVNPLRDGMNLVAKEGPLVNERDGVLVLSEEAGAYEELGGAALGVNPVDVTGTAAALGRALDMAADERARRAGELRRAAAAHSPADWLSAVLSAARQVS